MRHFKTPLDRFMSEQDLGDNELARLTGVPQPTISRIRQGLRKRPHEDVLARLAPVLGVTVAELQGKDIGDDLPPEAVAVARLWLKLAPTDRKKAIAILRAFQPAVADELVAKWLPPTPKPPK